MHALADRLPQAVTELGLVRDRRRRRWSRSVRRYFCRDSLDTLDGELVHLLRLVNVLQMSLASGDTETPSGSDDADERPRRLREENVATLATVQIRAARTTSSPR